MIESLDDHAAVFLDGGQLARLITVFVVGLYWPPIQCRLRDWLIFESSRDVDESIVLQHMHTSLRLSKEIVAKQATLLGRFISSGNPEGKVLLSMISLTLAIFVVRRIHLEELIFSSDVLAHFIMFRTALVPMVVKISYLVIFSVWELVWAFWKLF